MRTGAWVAAAAMAISVMGGAHAERVDLELLGQQGDMVMMAVPKSHAGDRAYIMRVAEGMCLRKTHCYVLFWQKGQGGARRLPMTDAQVRSQLASYTQNKATGKIEMLWNCRRFKDAPKASCMSD